MPKFGSNFSQLPLFPVLMLVSHRFVLSLILLINHFFLQQQEILSPVPSCEMVNYFHFHMHNFFFFWSQIICSQLSSQLFWNNIQILIFISLS